MVKKSIQYYFLNKKKKSIFRKVEYVDFGNIKRVAILFDYKESKDKKIVELINILAKNNIKSNAISYLQGDFDNIVREDIVCFSDDDFNIIGVVKDKRIKAFLDTEYDILFDLRDCENVISDYIHSMIRRKFSICYISSLIDNDIIVEAKNDMTFFSQNILEYLSKLKKA